MLFLPFIADRQRQGRSRLDTERVTLLGGESGPAVVPGDTDSSLLLAAIRYDGLAMPPNRQLSAEVIKDFEDWIAMGAPDPRKTATTTLRSAISDDDIAEARKNFWAYQPVRSHAAPTVKNSDWARTDIDRFVLANSKPTTCPPPPMLLPRKSFAGFITI